MVVLTLVLIASLFGWLVLRQLRAGRISAIEAKQLAAQNERLPSRPLMPQLAEDDTRVDTDTFRVVYPGATVELVLSEQGRVLMRVDGAMVNITCFPSNEPAAQHEPRWGALEVAAMSLYSWAALMSVVDPAVDDPAELPAQELRDVERLWDAREFIMDAKYAAALVQVGPDRAAAWGPTGSTVFVQSGSACIYIIDIVADGTMTEGLGRDLLWMTLENFEPTGCCDE